MTHDAIILYKVISVSFCIYIYVVITVKKVTFNSKITTELTYDGPDFFCLFLFYRCSVFFYRVQYLHKADKKQ